MTFTETMNPRDPDFAFVVMIVLCIAWAVVEIVGRIFQ